MPTKTKAAILRARRAKRIRLAINRLYGDQSKAAKTLNTSREHINRLANGSRNPTEAFLKSLHLPVKLAKQ